MHPLATAPCPGWLGLLPAQTWAAASSSRSVMSLMSIPTCACLETLTFYPIHVSSLGLQEERLLDQTLLPSPFFSALLSGSLLLLCLGLHLDPTVRALLSPCASAPSPILSNIPRE